MGKPLFSRVLLKVEIIKEKPLFGEAEKKPKIWIEDAANDCNMEVLQNIGSEVRFNGVVLEVVEVAEDYQLVLTHETNLLQLV
jgi:hypothetical protein